MKHEKTTPKVSRPIPKPVKNQKQMNSWDGLRTKYPNTRFFLASKAEAGSNPNTSLDAFGMHQRLHPPIAIV
jgi:hypothetical protein